MKKIIFSAALLAAAVISFNSCVKKDVKQNVATTNSTSLEKVILVCPLSDIYATYYSQLGNSLCGGPSSNGSGYGTTGALDTKLNCNKSAGPGCDLVNPIFAYSTSFSAGPGSYLSDGVMTVAEQQALVTQIQNACNAHKNANYGSAYTIAEYDCWYMQNLCGSCPDGMTLVVNYKAAKQCKN